MSLAVLLAVYIPLKIHISRTEASDDHDKFVTDVYCEGCVYHAGFIRGGGGASGMAPIGATPTAVDCRFDQNEIKVKMGERKLR